MREVNLMKNVWLGAVAGAILLAGCGSGSGDTASSTTGGTAAKPAKVQIICFDSEPDTITGLKDGSIAATVIQQPFEFGYKSMMLMAQYLDGKKDVFPASKQIIVDTQILDKSNIDDFLAKSGDKGGTSNPPPSTSTGSKGTIAFVTNNASDYWILARKGTEKAANELKDYKVQFVMNPSTDAAAAQKQKLQDLVTDGVKGIAVSPVDPTNQTPDLNTIAAKALLITQDSDAPTSNRVCYIGTDNVAAGKMAGEAVKKALPDGGKIMVFVGKKDAQNAKERYQGLQESLKGSKVTIIDIRTDDGDRARAKQNVADALVAYPDIAGCVGLWSYNGPAIYSAVKDAKRN
jgi:ABC-type sugar transport system substrate-binding protein